MIKKLLYGFVLFLCVALIGLSEFIIADFDTSIFYRASYWYSLISATIASALILYSTSSNDIDTYDKLDKDVVEKRDNLDRLVANNVENDFEKYIVEENLKRKVYAWKQKINRKLSRLEFFARQKNIELYYSEDEFLKSKSRYCIKRAKLEKLLTDEYINKHMYYLRVKYPKLKRYEITNGCRQKDEEYKLTTHRQLKILVDNLPRLAMSCGLVLFASSFIPDLKDFEWATIITFVIKLISLCMNFLNGKAYATYFKNSIMLPDLQYRTDKVLSYMTWKIDRNKNGGNNNDLLHD
jgi:hypothetical protein